MNLDLGDTRLIIDECKRFGCLRNQTAYILATAYHETAHTMKPVRETLAVSDQGARARLESAWKAGKLKWVKTPYWRSGWFGRGYVQLTHKANYERAQRETGYPFAADPSTALKPEPAAAVLVRGSMEGWFTGKKITDYITLEKSDFYNARRVINGKDRATDIAKIAEAYDKALKADGYGITDVAAIAEPKAKPKVFKDLTESKEVIGGITGLIAAISAFFEKLDGNTVAIILAALAIGFIANRLYARWKGDR